MERDIILSRLLDKYERSKHLLELGASSRRVMLRVDKKELPEYQYQEAETRDAFNQAAERLVQEGLVSAEWVKDRPVLSALVLNLEALERCYQAAGRTHPRARAERVAGEVQAELAHVETHWIAAWRDEVCTKAQSTYAVPQFCKKDAALLPDLLTALVQYDALRGESVTMRAFSSRCYHDSKWFERNVRETFLGIAQKYCPELAEACEQDGMGERDQLAFLGIYARPELYELSGKCVLTTEAGSIRVDAVWPFGIALPSTAVDSILSTDLSHIHKIAQAVPEGAQVFFWADIDLGGFRMFTQLQALIPGLLPLRMSGEDVAAYRENGLPRSQKYLERLVQALENGEFPLFDGAIRRILEHGVTIEQEIFLGNR